MHWLWPNFVENETLIGQPHLRGTLSEVRFVCDRISNMRMYNNSISDE